MKLSTPQVMGVVHHYGKTAGAIPGTDAYFQDAAHTAVFSVQADGSLETRSAPQGWESGVTDGNVWTVTVAGGPLPTRYSFLLASVVGQ